MKFNKSILTNIVEIEKENKQLSLKKEKNQMLKWRNRNEWATWRRGGWHLNLGAGCGFLNNQHVPDMITVRVWFYIYYFKDVFIFNFGKKGKYLKSMLVLISDF